MQNNNIYNLVTGTEIIQEGIFDKIKGLFSSNKPKREDLKDKVKEAVKFNFNLSDYCDVSDLYMEIVTEEHKRGFMANLNGYGEDYYLDFGEFNKDSFNDRIKKLDDWYKENELDNMKRLRSEMKNLEELYPTDPYEVNIYTDGFPFTLTLERLLKINIPIALAFYDENKINSEYSEEQKKMVKTIRTKIDNFMKEYNKIGADILKKQLKD